VPVPPLIPSGSQATPGELSVLLRSVLARVIQSPLSPSLAFSFLVLQPVSLVLLAPEQLSPRRGLPPVAFLPCAAACRAIELIRPELAEFRSATPTATLRTLAIVKAAEVEFLAPLQEHLGEAKAEQHIRLPFCLPWVCLMAALAVIPGNLAGGEFGDRHTAEILQQPLPVNRPVNGDRRWAAENWRRARFAPRGKTRRVGRTGQDNGSPLSALPRQYADSPLLFKQGQQFSRLPAVSVDRAPYLIGARAVPAGRDVFDQELIEAISISD